MNKLKDMYNEDPFHFCMGVVVIVGVFTWLGSVLFLR